MEQPLLVLATLGAGLGGVLGLRGVRQGNRSRWTLIFMLATFACQLGVLEIRGELRGKCPLGDYGEILAFLAWSLVLFYLVVGPTYQLSLLGLFTAPVVVVFQLVALIPGMMEKDPIPVEQVDPWGEAHAAFSVLSYGAFALAAIAGLMFLVLNRQLKDAAFGSKLFKNLPPVKNLLESVVRLIALGTGILTVGIVTGFMMEREGGAIGHLIAAVATWIAYAGLLGWHWGRGWTPRRLVWGVNVVFVFSLLVFAFV